MLPIQTAHHTFLESRHSEITKNLYYGLSTYRSQIAIFQALVHRLQDTNISPFSLNPYFKISMHSLFHIVTSKVQAQLGYRAKDFILLPFFCKSMSFNSPLGLIKIWLISEVFLMPEKVHTRVAKCSKTLLKLVL